MYAPPPELLALVDALRGSMDPRPLLDGLEALTAPWRVAVVGRVGVGKSTLVNLLAGGRERPTGLGGVTLEAAEVALDGRIALIDTPGIDEEAAALAALAPLLERVDAVIFVVDGLQPLTATERAVLGAALPEGTPLHLVVSKLDLTDAHEAPRVLERVGALTRAHAPRSVRRLDLRSALEAPRELVEPTPTPPPRRLAALRAALDAVQGRLDALPPAPSRDALLRELRDRWTACVRATERAVDAGLGSDADSRLLALDRLARAAAPAVEALRRELAADPRLPGVPALPIPAPPDGPPVKQVLATMAGLEGARRHLRAAAARWLLDGEVALLDWAEELGDLDEAHRARRRALDALAGARAALDRWGGEPGRGSAATGEARA